MEAHERPLAPLFEPVFASGDDVEQADLAEVEAAVAMVSAGTAVRVLLVGLRNPAQIAGIAAAIAQARGLSFRLVPSDTSHSLLVGPRT